MADDHPTDTRPGGVERAAARRPAEAELSGDDFAKRSPWGDLWQVPTILLSGLLILLGLYLATKRAPENDFDGALDQIDRLTASGRFDLAGSRLTDVVASHTLGDVTAGAFLSGGLDSGTLVALLARCTTEPVPVFTIAFDDPDLDESADAARVARTFGCRHHVEVVQGVELDELIPLLRAYGEPSGDVSLLPTHRVARLAARHVKFVLSGDGGDELFAGYSWLLREVHLRRLPLAGAAPWLLPFLARGQRSQRADLLGKALRAAGDIASGPMHSFLRRRSLCPPHLVEPLLHRRLRRPRRSVRYQQEQWARGHGGDPLQLCLDLDRRFYLPGDILEKLDRATMLHSLEARVPFLDHRLVELAARIPVGVHLGPRGRGKAVLRRVIANVLPAPLLGRRKRGFGIPVDRWLRGPLGAAVRERLLDPGFRQRELVDDAMVRRLLEEQRRGFARHGHLLWGLVSLAVWAETLATAPAAAGTAHPGDRTPTSARSATHPG